MYSAVMVNKENFQRISSSLQQKQVALVAVSKTKSVEEIKSLYDLGQRDFGENYVQELLEKQQRLPEDIRWHFIGHLQTNKVKYIIPFISLVQSVDSLKLLKEINKQAGKFNRIVDVLLQVHIAKEETKFGLDENELSELLDNKSHITELKFIRIRGIMGMASFTDNSSIVKNEFRYLRMLLERFYTYKSENVDLAILSMGMSSDYTTAVEEGSNMVRIGSLIFGERTSF
jgi:pyridoxal phosphate enzyme (YggS family)